MWIDGTLEVGDYLSVSPTQEFVSFPLKVLAFRGLNTIIVSRLQMKVGQCTQTHAVMCYLAIACATYQELPPPLLQLLLRHKVILALRQLFCEIANGEEISGARVDHIVKSGERYESHWS
jgi:hypothetical protein